MLKKNERRSEKKHRFFSVDIASIFRGKSMKNRAKSLKTVFVHKNRQKITCGTLFFSKNTILSDSSGSSRIPRGVRDEPGNPQNR